METTDTTINKTSHKTWLIPLIAGVIIGMLLFVSYRVIVMKDMHTHYHANFALYVNGQLDEFKSPTYYEEIQTCGAEEGNPRSRAHLHDQNAAAVHVHDEGTTWGHLLANLGYSLGDTVLKTSNGTYIDGTDGSKLTFLLNGESVIDVANRVIGNEDVLLINYGQQDRATLKTQLAAIPRTAGEKNATADPATCSGSQPLTISERLKRAFSAN